MDLPSSTEPIIRLAAFAGVFAAMAAWELRAPKRPRTVRRIVRWPGNLGIVALDTLLVRFALPTAVAGVALHGEAAGWGVLRLVALPEWIEVVAAVVLLDLAIYLQHVVFHAVPLLWRLHRMHHADLDVDVTTGVRFHPIEIFLSLLIKIAVVAAIGASAVAVVIFEVLLNATSMFNHGNVRLPGPLDALVRALLVTPDMHRVHHSIDPKETNSNFGFNLSVWDRLFGTYRGAPAAGHAGMTLGIPAFRDPGELRLDRMLTQPFRQDGATQSSGRLASGLTHPPRADTSDP